MATTLCFTGHRPNKLVGYDKNNYQDFVNHLAIRLEDYVKNFGITNFISGGAQGFDQLAFWAVHKLKRNHPEWHIQNIVYVPFIGQEVRWKKSGLFSQAEYQLMLRHADQVHICNPTVKANADFKDIRAALLQRNQDMVNDSDRVLAMYSHQEALNHQLTPGGTASCVSYAQSINKPIDQCIYHIINNQLIFG